MRLHVFLSALVVYRFWLNSRILSSGDDDAKDGEVINTVEIAAGEESEQAFSGPSLM